MMGSSLHLTAACSTQSPTVGIPNGRFVPSAFGKYRLSSLVLHDIFYHEGIAGALLSCVPSRVHTLY